MGAIALNAQSTINLSFAPSEAHLFSPGFISSGKSERDFAITAAGDEIYYTIQSPQGAFQTIVCSKKQRDGRWSKPEIVSFGGMYSDLEPALSGDGKTMFFASNRPIEGQGIKDFDIWKVERTRNGWGEPINLGKPVNTDSDEFYPSITNSGNLYFTANYKSGPGKEDIFIAEWKNGNYQQPKALDGNINTAVYEFNAFVSPQEDYILFTGYGREDDSGKGDIYMSMKDQNGKWKPAKNLSFINSKSLDYCPSLSPDGKMLFFTSERADIKKSYAKAVNMTDLETSLNNPLNGGGNIYWVNFDAVKEHFNK